MSHFNFTICLNTCQWHVHLLIACFYRWLVGLATSPLDPGYTSPSHTIFTPKASKQWNRTNQMQPKDCLTTNQRQTNNLNTDSHLLSVHRDNFANIRGQLDCVHHILFLSITRWSIALFFPTRTLKYFRMFQLTFLIFIIYYLVFATCMTESVLTNDSEIPE